MSNEKERNEEMREHNRARALGGLWQKLGAKMQADRNALGVTVTGVTIKPRQGDVLVVVKGQSQSGTNLVTFIPCKDWEHVGDAIQHAVTQATWQEERPFSLAEWQERNRRRL